MSAEKSRHAKRHWSVSPNLYYPEADKTEGTSGILLFYDPCLIPLKKLKQIVLANFYLYLHTGFGYRCKKE